MSRVSDKAVTRVYNSLKVYVENNLRDDVNPNIALISFNQVPPASLSHITIPVTGIQRLNTRKVDRILADFPDGGAQLYNEEGVDGKLEYWIEVPVPKKRSKSKKRSRSSKRVSYAIDPDKPSCTKLLLMVCALLALGIVGVMLTIE